MKIAAALQEGHVISEGNHILTLLKVEQKRITDKFAKSEDGKVDKLLWVFRLSDTAEEYVVWTKTAYGDDRAELTKLLDGMIAGMNKARLETLDTDELVGQRYRARIVHKVSAATGKTSAHHVYIEPLEDIGTEPRESLVAPTSSTKTAKEVDASW